MPRNMTRIFFVIMAALVCLVLVQFHQRSSFADEKPATPPAGAEKDAAKPAGEKPKAKGAPVLVAEAVRGSIPIQLSAIGNVQAGATVGVKSRINGDLLKVHFEEGQDVKKGDILFTIDSRDLEATLREAKAQLARSRAQLRKAEEDKRRYDELMRQQIISRDQQETTATSLAVLQAQIAANQAAVDSAQVQLSYAIIRSPLDGRTGEVLLNAGNMVKANADTPMVTVQQVEPLDVRFTVPEMHLGTIMAAQSAGGLRVRAAAPGQNKTAEGKIAFIDSSVDAQTGTIALKASFPNRDRALWPGQFVNVIFELGRRENVVLAPTQAVSTGSEGDFVYILKPDNTVEYRLVTAGPIFDGKTLIEKGLQGGEKVVIDGHLRLAPGAAVEVRTPGQGSAGGKQ